MVLNDDGTKYLCLNFVYISEFSIVRGIFILCPYEK